MTLRDNLLVNEGTLVRQEVLRDVVALQEVIRLEAINLSTGGIREKALPLSLSFPPPFPSVLRVPNMPYLLHHGVHQELILHEGVGIRLAYLLTLHLKGLHSRGKGGKCTPAKTLHYSYATYPPAIPASLRPATAAPKRT